MLIVEPTRSNIKSNKGTFIKTKSLVFNKSINCHSNIILLKMLVIIDYNVVMISFKTFNIP